MVVRALIVLLGAASVCLIVLCAAHIVRMIWEEYDMKRRSRADYLRPIVISGPSDGGKFATMVGTTIVSPVPAGATATLNLITGDLHYSYHTDTHKTMDNAAFSLDGLELAQEYINGAKNGPLH